MTDAMSVWLIVLGIPLVAVLFGWMRLCSRWRLETHHLRALTALIMTTAPVALANGAFVYVSLGKPYSSTNYTIERTGLLLSASALATAVSSTRCTERWISILTCSISAFMFALFFLMASTI